MLPGENPVRVPCGFRRPLTVFLHSLCLICLLAGCATALKRESECLISLTPDVLQAHEEIASLETTWRESLARRDVVVLARSSSEGYRVWEVRAAEPSNVEAARVAAKRSYEQLVEARMRHQPILTMYDKVYQRVRTRTEEESILSNVRTFMLAGPASFVLYPIIHWNVRTVLWDGGDPDAATDPIGQFCRSRLATDSTRPESGASATLPRGEAPGAAVQPPADISRPPAS